MSRRVVSWPEAARHLARRVGRRDRLRAVLEPLGRALLAGGGAAVLLKLVGVGAPLPEAVLVGGAVAGALLALRGLRRTRPVRVAAAAWALDRIAGARERGLVAATVEGPVGAEAAWGRGRVDPPAVRLVPPPGLAPALGGALAVVLALVIPHAAAGGGGGPPAPAGPPAARQGAAPGSLGALEAEEDRARADAARARAAASVREALGLGEQDAADPERVAERLAAAEARMAAADAAPEGSDLAAMLSSGASARELADALARGAEAEGRARERRRQAAAARAGAGLLDVPAERRPLLERYYWLLGARPGGVGGR